MAPHPYRCTDVLTTCVFIASIIVTIPSHSRIASLLSRLFEETFIRAQHPCSCISAIFKCAFMPSTMAKIPPASLMAALLLTLSHDIPQRASHALICNIASVKWLCIAFTIAVIPPASLIKFLFVTLFSASLAVNRHNALHASFCTLNECKWVLMTSIMPSKSSRITISSASFSAFILMTVLSRIVIPALQMGQQPILLGVDLHSFSMQSIQNLVLPPIL
mmetsp:Transcript_6167/g.8925  ORF Transcript_6167/g.8925 Transcript_6167/m.8925 type:complete len:220 (-) Transcript_6167:177-836(-)